MFNSLAIKILTRENARLRRELRRKETQVAELLDNFIFHKIPERLVTRNFSSQSGTGGTVSAHSPSPEYMGDAYSSLIRELEEEIDSQTTYPADHPDLNNDDD